MTFDALSLRMKSYFLISIFLMLLHKIECYYTEEWLESPFFLAIITSSHWAGMDTTQMMGEVMFLVFCIWLFIGLFMGWLVLRGGNWGPIALAVWGLTYVLEWHHVIRTLARGEYYSGVYSSIVYLAFGFFYWRELSSHIHREPPAE